MNSQRLLLTVHYIMLHTSLNNKLFQEDVAVSGREKHVSLTFLLLCLGTVDSCTHRNSVRAQ